MLRSLLYILFFFISFKIVVATSYIYESVSFFSENTVPFYISFLLTNFVIHKYVPSKVKLSNFEFSWIAPLCNVSIFISLIIIILTLQVSGRDAKLEAISSNLILYYLSFLNTAIIIIVLSSFFQPYKKTLDSKTTKLIFFMVSLAILISYSRSLAFFLIISILVSGVHTSINLKKLILLGLPILTLVLLMPLLQGRTEDGVFAIIRTLQNVFYYNAFPFFLGEHLIERSDIYSGLSLGYGGYLFSNTFNLTLDSNAFFDNKVLYDFIKLGESLLYGDVNANVMYPLWAIVSIDYGPMSFLYYLTLSLTIIALMLCRLTVIASWIYFRCYILGFMVSPFLLRDTIFELVLVLLIQFFLYGKAYKLGRKK